MAEVITTGLLRVVVDKLSSEVTKEFWLLMGLDKDLEKMRGTLSTIQDVLEDAESRQVKDKALKGWLKKLKDVAYDADDVLDEIAAKSAKRRHKSESSLTDKVRNLLETPKSLMYSRKVAHRVKEIRETLDEIAEERSKFHLREGLVSRSETSEPTGSLVKESEIFGRQKEKEKIIDFLLNKTMCDEDDDLAVMPIVGLGGLGKTTLAQLVYNDERVKKTFEKMMWVCVSIDFDAKRIYRSITESITGTDQTLNDMDSMQRCVSENLKDKKFLLVLDDVWNENHEKWDRLRIALTSGAKGSKIIVTTRSQRVVSIMSSTVEPCMLTGLSEENCWLLFEKRAFGFGGAAKNPNLEAIGREIVKKCGGVPLAAKALGSLMRFKRKECEWLEVRDSEIWRLSDDENEILPALKLSYNYLPSHLKQCFAYCTIFPKASEISKKTLVRLWIAEGFVRSSARKLNLEEVGDQFVDELLSRSLFQNCEHKPRLIKLHDLIHDLARSIAGDECAIFDASAGTGIAQNSRYSSFSYDAQISEILEPVHEAKKLRTFYLIAPEGKREDEEDADKAEEILNSLFSNSRVLRALHLYKCPVKTLPDSIKRLKLLRYLNLSHTSLRILPPCICRIHNLDILDLSNCSFLKSLPDSFGDLLNLRTLYLSHCSSLKSLPNSIGRLLKLRDLDLSFCQITELPESLSLLSNLENLLLQYCYLLRKLPSNLKNMKSLIHLNLYSCYELTCIPAGISQLKYLRTLPRLVLGGNSGCNISELSDLNLQEQLEITNLENVRNAEEARKANLNKKHNIRSLWLSWDVNTYTRLIRECHSIGSMENFTESSIAELVAQWSFYAQTAQGVLKALQPHVNLKKLGICSYIGQRLPCWMMELSLPNLTEITLSNCINCTSLPPFGQLPCLKVLYLSMLPAVKCLGSEFYGGSPAFPFLRELTLSDMEELEDWSGPSNGDFFPRLEKLSLRGCPKMKALPSNFPSVTTLEMNVDEDLVLSSLRSGAFPNLKHLTSRNCGEDYSVPEVVSQRMNSIESYSMETKPKPSASDPTEMSVTGFASVPIYGGTNIFELPLF